MGNVGLRLHWEAGIEQPCILACHGESWTRDLRVRNPQDLFMSMTAHDNLQHLLESVYHGLLRDDGPVGARFIAPAVGISRAR